MSALGLSSPAYLRVDTPNKDGNTCDIRHVALYNQTKIQEGVPSRHIAAIYDLRKVSKKTKQKERTKAMTKHGSVGALWLLYSRT